MTKRTDAQVQALWRTVLAVICARSGLKLTYVLDQVPYVGSAKRNLLQTQANGCRHLAIYLLRTAYGVPITQLGRVAELSHQQVHRVITYVARSRDENMRDYDEWLGSYEQTLDTMGEHVDA